MDITRFIGKFALGCAIILSAQTAQAARFTNQFVEFELPNRWNCSLEGAEWVCQSTDEQRRRDGIIVLAAKLKGEQDSLDKYQEYLSKNRVFTAPNGKSVSSQPKYARVSTINAHPWVDSLHLESEIPGFYTRYLATIKQDIGILVTYSINKDKYQEYLSQFDGMVKSLKAFRKQGGVNTSAGQSIFQQATPPGQFTQSVFPDQKPAAPADAPEKKTASKGEDNTMLLLLLAVAIVGFIIYKKKRGGA
jgi:hypothetical protein